MIRRKSIEILIIFCALFYTYPSIAEGGGGMPQMVIPDFMPQLVWLFIIFPILYLTMKYMALPRISEIISNRDIKIINNLNKAEEIRNKIDELNKEHQLAIKETNEQIKLIVSEISQKSIVEAEKKLIECQNKINATIKEEKVFEDLHVVIIHRENKYIDNFENILSPILVKSYGRSKIIFAKFN